MARTPRLKVYRMPIGFHDAYVAAPSRKAALAAWGSDADLFARGVAEQVDDPDLARDGRTTRVTVLQPIQRPARLEAPEAIAPQAWKS